MHPLRRSLQALRLLPLVLIASSVSEGALTSRSYSLGDVPVAGDFNSETPAHPSLPLGTFLTGRTTDNDYRALFGVRADTGALEFDLRIGAGWKSRAIYSPDGGWLAIESNDGGLWLRNSASGALRFVGSAKEIWDVVFTSTSSHIVYAIEGIPFAQPVAGGPSVCLLPTGWEAAGSVVTEIQAIPGSNAVVFEVKESTAAHLIRVLPDGTGYTVLSSSPAFYDWSVTGDGAHVVLSPFTGGLASVPLSGPAVVTPLNVGFQSVPFAITEDGAFVVYAADNGTYDSLYRIRPTGGVSVEIITSGAAGDVNAFIEPLHISPDGATVVYSEKRGSGSFFCAVPLAGGARVELTEDSDTIFEFVTSTHLVCFGTFPGAGRQGVYSVSLADGTKTMLSGISLSGTTPEFHVVPDSGLVFYTLDELDAGQWDTFQISADGTGLVRLTSSAVRNLTELFDVPGGYVLARSGQVTYRCQIGVAGSATALVTLPNAETIEPRVEALSADGTKLLVAGTLSATREPSETMRLHLFDRSTGAGTEVSAAYTRNDGFSTYDIISGAGFSADQNWCIFMEESETAAFGEVLVGRRNSDGLRVELSDPTLLVSPGSFDDGLGDRSFHSLTSRNELLYATNDDVYLARLDGSTAPWTNLTSHLGSGVTRILCISPTEDEMVVAKGSTYARVQLDGSGSAVIPYGLDPVYSDDGAWLFFHNGTWIYRVRIADGTVSLHWTEGADIQDIHYILRDNMLVVLDGTDTSDGRIVYMTADEPVAWLTAATGIVPTGVTLKMAMDEKLIIFSHPDQDRGQPRFIGFGGALEPTLPAMVEGGTLSGWQVTPDGTKLVFRADATVDERHELFVLDLATGAISTIGPALSGASDVRDDWQIASDLHVVLRSDAIRPGYPRLYLAALDGSRLLEAAPASMTASGAAWSIQAVDATGAEVFSAMDPEADGSVALYGFAYAPDVTPIADLNLLVGDVVPSISATIADFEVAAADLTVSYASSNPALVPADLANLVHAGSSVTLNLGLGAGEWGRSRIDLQVSDAISTTTRSFQVTVLPDANDHPTAIQLDPAYVSENAAAGTIVGTLTATDADAWDVHTFALVPGAGSDDNGNFLVSGTQLRTTGPMDEEADAVRSIRVRATDFAGLFIERQLSVTLLDQTGEPLDFSKTVREGVRTPLPGSDFLSNFLLNDGGGLQRIRIEAVPTHGDLRHRLSRRTVDAVATGASGVAAGDVNGDGRPDIVAVLAGSGQVVWYENTGTSLPSFTRRVIASGLNAPADVILTDLNSDGARDAVVAVDGDSKVIAYLNSGGASPSFAGVTVYSTTGGAVSVAAFDADADGDVDIVSAHPGTNQVVLHRSNGASVPGFLGTVVSSSETGAAALGLRDLDLDGDQDLIVAAKTAGELVWFEQIGASYTRRVIATGLASPSCLDLGDVDGDGRTDIVVGTEGDQTVRWYRNNPGATPSLPPTFAASTVAASLGAVVDVRIADANGDAIPDIVSSSPLDGILRLHQTQRGGSVTFMTSLVDGRAGGVRGAVVADFSMNGRPDLAAAHALSNLVVWYQDERILAAGDELELSDLERFGYQPPSGFLGSDAFQWNGFDGSDWAAVPATVTLGILHGEYWDWLIAAFGDATVRNAALESTIWGEDADPDFDGTANLLEYAFGGSPLNPTDTGVRPYVQMTVDGSTWVEFVHGVRASDPHLSYSVETTSDLATWSRDPARIAVHGTDQPSTRSGIDLRTWRYGSAWTATSQPAHFRVHVQRVP